MTYTTVLRSVVLFARALYDFGVSISSFGQALEVRSISSAWILPRHVAELVECDQRGYQCWERITYKAADHAVSVLVRVVGCFVVAFVASKDLRAATEAEPAIGFTVVRASATPWQFLACNDAELFFRLIGETSFVSGEVHLEMVDK